MKYYNILFRGQDALVMFRKIKNIERESFLNYYTIEHVKDNYAIPSRITNRKTRKFFATLITFDILSMTGCESLLTPDEVNIFMEPSKYKIITYTSIEDWFVSKKRFKGIAVRGKSCTRISKINTKIASNKELDTQLKFTQ